MQMPILHVFLISHYCEKARWALDLCGVNYQVNLLSPLAHAKTAKRIGAARSALPILQIGSKIIQGSSEIIAWANTQAKTNSKQGLLITPESSQIEKRLDDVLGLHVRRWYYSESLIDCPEIVKPVFAQGSGLIGRMTLNLAWPKVVATMIKRMDLGRAQESESQAIVVSELDWLDSLLVDESSEHKNFLVGDMLSNADIAAASLIAPMFCPPNHPAVDLMNLPPRITETVAQWHSKPFATWLTDLYLQSR